MKIAYVLFNNITLLDFIGVYDAVLRLKTMNYIPELSWDLCALTDKVSDELGLTLLTNKTGGSLKEYDGQPAVSSSIDLGLYLCHKWAGAEAAAATRRRMDYRG